MEAEQILKRIGYDNNSITTTEKWIAKEVYKLAMEDAAALRQPPVSGSVCLHRFYHVKNSGYVYCTDCNKKLGSQTDC